MRTEQAKATGIAYGDVVFDRFMVLTRIGEGATSDVYLVRDNYTDKLVALKILKKELIEDSAMLSRFRKEVFYCSNIEHENIVAIKSLFDIAPIVLI